MNLQQQIDDLRERVIVLEERLHALTDRLNADLLRMEVLWRDRKRKAGEEEE